MSKLQDKKIYCIQEKKIISYNACYKKQRKHIIPKLIHKGKGQPIPFSLCVFGCQYKNKELTK